MMKTATILSSLALVATSLAAPAPTYEQYPKSTSSKAVSSQKSNSYQTQGQTWTPSNTYGQQPSETKSSSKKDEASYEQNTWNQNTYKPETTYAPEPTTAESSYQLPGGNGGYKSGAESSQTNDEDTPSATDAPSGSATFSEPAAAASSGISLASGNGTTGGGSAGNLGIPSNCLKHGNIPIGWLPDQDAGVEMSAITSKLGAESCFYGLYSQIKGSSYDDGQLTAKMDDIKKSGAVFQPAVMPTNVKFGDIGTELAGQIAASMKKFTDEGITVWLRFAHEVNWYVTDGTYAGGSADEFKKAWQTVAEAVKDNDKVFMYWSPNNVKDASDLDQWFPGAEYVDVVGIDIYPDDGKLGDFKGVYGNFYDKFSAPNNIPFAVGETAAGGQEQQKKWLTSLANGDESMPNYVGFAWFEYDKEKDWRVVTGPSGDIAGPILKGSA